MSNLREALCANFTKDADSNQHASRDITATRYASTTVRALCELFRIPFTDFTRTEAELERRLKAEPVDPNPWVSVAERLPTEGDAYMDQVLWHGQPDDPKQIDSGSWKMPHGSTHWKRLIPPVIPDEPERREFETVWKVFADPFATKEECFEAYKAARAVKGGES